jgi:hypothetical protein
VFNPFTSFWALSLEAPTFVEHKEILFSLQLSTLKARGWVQWVLCWCFLQLLNSKLRSSKRGRSKLFCAQLPSFDTKSWGQVQNNLLCPLSLLSSSKLESFKRGYNKFSCLNWALKKTKKLQNFKTLYKLKAYKHKIKSLKKKLEKLGNILQIVVFVRPPPPTRTRTQEYICKNLNQNNRVSNTPF